jgi:hypothetical protein
MKFTPKSEEEISAANLVAAGDYDFEVADAKEETSKGGNDMVKLKLNIEGEEGRRHVVFDYLVGTEASMFKVRGFAETTGMLPQYDRGDMDPSEMIGRTGRATIAIDDKNKAYAPKNVVRAYLKADAKTNGSAAMPPRASSRHPIDDDIPFAPEWR